MELDSFQLKRMLEQDRLLTIELTTLSVMENMGLSKDRMTKAEVIEKFGSGSLKQWEKAELIKGKKTGTAPNSPIYYSRKKCVELFRTDEFRRHIYFQNKEQKTK